MGAALFPRHPAGGKGRGVIIKNGKEIETVAEADLLDRLWFHIQQCIKEKEARQTRALNQNNQSSSSDNI